MKYIELVGELRNDSLEKNYNSCQIVYFSSRLELDTNLLAAQKNVKKFGLKLLFANARNRSLLIIEIPEPLFLKFWFQGSSCAIIIKLIRKILWRETVIVTYAIENLDANAICSVPFFNNNYYINKVFSKILKSTLVATSSCISVAGFGTKSAEKNYLDNGFFKSGRINKFLSQEILQSCDCEFSNIVKKKSIVFLGERSYRKSTDELYSVFLALSALNDKWLFHMVGPSIDTYATPNPLNFKISGKVPRREIHKILSESSLLILPSRRLPRWREQIGLPIIEGLKHNVHVIATKESGLYEEQRNNPNITWIESSDENDIKNSIENIINRDNIVLSAQICLNIPSHFEFKQEIFRRFSDPSHELTI